ncbi:GIY-YIG nuclease family protein [Patescibacteria group bacterium]|nr:GIY-YIG nuclease family protein [Patescibacteria group bacterium]
MMRIRRKIKCVSGMFYVYVLKSCANNDMYIGSTEDVEKRISLHNAGRVRSTKSYRPWVLLEVREAPSRSEAMKLERFLKTGQQKEMLKRKYNIGLIAKW